MVDGAEQSCIKPVQTESSMMMGNMCHGAFKENISRKEINSYYILIAYYCLLYFTCSHFT